MIDLDHRLVGYMHVFFNFPEMKIWQLLFKTSQ